MTENMLGENCNPCAAQSGFALRLSMTHHDRAGAPRARMRSRVFPIDARALPLPWPALA
jgi:hypothetical protein